MSRVSRARRIAVGAAYGGGGLVTLGAAALGVLLGEAAATRRAIRPLAVGPPSADGIYGAALPGRMITLAILGDSSMVGYGVDTVAETPGAVLANGVCALTDRPVRIVSAARIGAVSQDLHDQARAIEKHRPDAAAIFIGANDVTHRVMPATAVGHLRQAVAALRAMDVEVVVGTCPDLGTIQPIPQPLRWVARKWSRDLAAAQTIAVVEAGGRTVSLGDLLGAEFAARPAELFSADRFHPSAVGYARAVAALLPSVVDALSYELPTGDAEVPGEQVQPLAEAAANAAGQAGTEVTATDVGGRDRGPWGRWAQLRPRIRFRLGRDYRPGEDLRPGQHFQPGGPEPVLTAPESPAPGASAQDGT